MIDPRYEFAAPKFCDLTQDNLYDGADAWFSISLQTLSALKRKKKASTGMFASPGLMAKSPALRVSPTSKSKFKIWQEFSPTQNQSSKRPTHDCEDTLDSNVTRGLLQFGNTADMLSLDSPLLVTKISNEKPQQSLLPIQSIPQSIQQPIVQVPVQPVIQQNLIQQVQHQPPQLLRQRVLSTASADIPQSLKIPSYLRPTVASIQHAKVKPASLPPQKVLGKHSTIATPNHVTLEKDHTTRPRTVSQPVHHTFNQQRTIQKSHRQLRQTQQQPHEQLRQPQQQPHQHLQQQQSRAPSTKDLTVPVTPEFVRRERNKAKHRSLQYPIQQPLDVQSSSSPLLPIQQRHQVQQTLQVQQVQQKKQIKSIVQ